MKKTILCTLLVLLVAVLVMPASAATEKQAHDGTHCLCVGNIDNHICDNNFWQPLPEGTADFGKLSSGSYYLTSDVTVTGTTAITDGKDIRICLNGYDITASGGRCFGNTNEASLSITDCSYSNGTWGGTVTGGNSVYGQIIYTHCKSTVNIYGGNFTGSSTARLAGLFCIAQDGADENAKSDPAYKAVMNIYNGNIYGGKAGKGGNIYAMHCGQVNMYGGQIHDGIASYIEWTDSNSTKSQVGLGGNVHIDKAASFNLHGGSVYGGTAAQGSKDAANAGSGGNFSVNGTLNIYGGSVYNGLAQHNPITKENGTAWTFSTPGRGGNIYANGSNAALNISGGCIYDGAANGIGGGNIWMETGTFNLSGGKIWGGIANADNDKKNSAGLVNTYEVCGGSVRIQNGTFNMTGGSIGIDDAGNPAGGTTLPSGSECGNCYFFGTDTKVSLSGGTIANGNKWLDENGKLTYGVTSKGGNMGGNGAITVSGTMVIRDGYATSVGGNWTLFNNGSCTISGGTITGGIASQGGNIIIDGSTEDKNLLTITGGIISNGTATTKEGGNIAIDHASKGVAITGGTITGGTAKTKGGNIYCIGSLSFDSTTLITDGAPGDVMVMSKGSYVSQYTTLSEAISNVQADQYLRLTGTVRNAAVSGDVLIDLAGNHMTGVTVTGDPCFMDTTTDGYDGTNAGSLTLASGTLENSYKTTEVQAGAIKRYLPIKENGSYSFHRYYMAITKLTLKPGTVGMGYKATFVGSDYIKQRLSGTIAYGYSMWLTEDVKIQRGYPASRFGGEQELTLRIDNFLATGLNAAKNEERANQKVYASVYLRLADGTLVETDPVSYTFREMLELANTQYSSYSSSQQSALRTLSSKFSASMISWDINNIHHATGSVWRSVTSSAFNTILKSNSNNLPSGSYVLSQDVDIGTRSISILEGRTVNICLNGYTLTGSRRMFNTRGTLNFCDCHADGQEGNVLSTFTNDADDTDSGEFTSIIYCYYSSVTNLYGGNLKNNGSLSFAGLIAVSHDGDGEHASKPVGVFNMYGGTISGGNVTGDGGNVTLWNKGIFNLYGGTIYGGTARYGGAFNITNGCALNIYGGTVTGGTSTGGRGGNIYNNKGNLNIYGGTVTGGTAPVLTNESGKTVLSTGLGGGICVSDGNINISGSTVIDGNNGSNLYLKGISTISIENLTAEAKIGLSADVRGAVSTDPTVAGKLTSERDGFTFHNVNGKLILAPEGFTASAVKPSVSSFSVGFAMNDVTPTESGLVMSSWGNPSGRKTNGDVNYTPYVTTVAITDKENNTILMVTMDIQNAPETYLNYICTRISEATGVPAGNIYLSATHTHNCPTLNTSTEGNARYTALFIDQLVQGALDALADRAPATMQIGSFDTVGMNWSRHYYYYENNDKSGEKIYFGDQFGTGPQNGETVYRVREGDTTMHMLAFNRTGKQPVLLTNWRAHPHRSGGKNSYTVDADVIGATREYMHENTDYLFAYFQGAAGNMNTTSRLSGQTYKSGKITEYGNELGRQITEGMKNLQTVETGLIQTQKIIYAANVDHSQDDKYEDAVALRDYYNNNPTEMDTLEEQLAVAATYGFTSVFHATRLITKYNLPETRDIELNIFSIGDHIAFYTAPGELWDSFSEEIEGLSPFDTTFCIGYSNGNVAYIPYKLDYENSYEDLYCLFVQDETIMQMRAYYLQYLEDQYENAQ